MRVAARRAMAAAAALATLATPVLVACAEPPTTQPTRTGKPTPSQTPRGDPSEHSQIDVDFAQMLIVHTRQSSEMIALAADRAERPEVVELAEAMAEDDARNVAAMTALLEEWGVAVPDEIAITEMDHSQMDHAGIGMGFMAGISDDQVTLLSGLDGASFDRTFLKFMLTHRGAAVAMAQSERIYGQYGEAIKVAKTIEKVQADQMDQIVALRKAR